MMRISLMGFSLFFLLLFPNISFSQGYLIVSRDTPFYAGPTGQDRLKSHVKDDFMSLQILERKDDRIRVRAVDRSLFPCAAGLSLYGIELDFWIEKTAPLRVLNKYKTWNFSDGSSAALAAGSLITATGAGELHLPVDKEDIGRSFKLSFVPANDSEGNPSFCHSGNCREALSSEKGMRYNGSHYLKRKSFFGERVHDRCLSVQGKLDDPKTREVKGFGKGGGTMVSVGSRNRATIAKHTPLLSPNNQPIGRTLRTLTFDNWKIGKEVSCTTRRYQLDVQLCAKNSDISWVPERPFSKDEYPRVVVKKKTKFYASPTDKKAAIHLKRAKGYATLILLEEGEERVKVRLQNKNQFSQHAGCYDNFSLPNNLSVEFWVVKESLLKVTDRNLDWNFSDGSKVTLAAGHVVDGKTVYLEHGKLRLDVDPKRLTTSVPKKQMHAVRRPRGRSLSTSSKRKLPRKNDKLLLASLKTIDSFDGGLNPRKKTRRIFSSKKGIQYGKNKYRFPPMQIFTKGSKKEIGNRCFRIRGELKNWEDSKALSQEKFLKDIVWKKGQAIVGSTIVSRSGNSIGSVKRGISQELRKSAEEKLSCQSVALVQGHKSTSICIAEKDLIKQKKIKQNSFSFGTKTGSTVLTKAKVSTKNCDAKQIRDAFEKGRKFNSFFRNAQGRAKESLHFTLKFTESGSILSLITTHSSLVWGEYRITRKIMKMDLEQKACSADVELEFEIPKRR